MCGIAGIIGRDKRDKSQKVKNMLASIKYRGPDETGMMETNDVSMGMNRLSIIDTKAHNPPYVNEDGTLFVVFNGEIYNFKELRSNLKDSHTFKTTSDAEIILHLYEEKGISFVDDLNGMYAISLYDSKRLKLYLIRDKMGEKPLYFVKKEGFIAFASEIKALFEVVPPVLNHDCLDYRVFEFSCGEETLFEGIFSIGPGEYLEVDLQALDYEKKSYWKVWDNYIDLPDNEEHLADELSHLLVDAINLRKENNAHGFGCYISGGVDSAIVASISQPDYIFTCHYELGKDFDEIHYAKLLAKHIGKNLNIVEPKPEDYFRTNEKLIYHLDTPCTWTSFSLWCLLEASAGTVKVILNGDGADEIFAGYHRYHLLNHDQQIYQMESMKQYQFMMDRYYGEPYERYSRLISRNEDRFDEKANAYLREKVKMYFSKADDIVNAMGITDAYTTMQVLLQMGDRMCMAFGVENRSPFLDPRVVQFGFSLDLKYKIRNGTTKYLLKKVAKRFIPHEIADRIDKRGFSAPLNRWFGWDKIGTYQRGTYKNVVFNDWVKVFGVNTYGESDARQN